MDKNPDNDWADRDLGRQQPINGSPEESADDLASKIDPDMGTPETHANPAAPGPGDGSPGRQEDAAQAGRVSSGADALTDDSRSGADVGEAVDVAESGTKAQGDHSRPERAKTGEAPVEQVFNDPAMTEGQRTVPGPAGTTGGVPPGPSPAEAGSGGAQSVVGPRESDRLAAGEPPAAGAPFETDTNDRPTKPEGQS